MDNLISRQAAIDAANDWLLDCFKVQKQDRSCGLIRRLEDLPSALSIKPDNKPISYQDCSDALLMMWMENVLTDGEYRRIADKLKSRWEEG